MSRRITREKAFQSLYELDITKDDAKKVIEYVKSQEDKLEMEYLRTVVLGVLDKVEEVDSHIQKYSKKWKVDRMAKVDKAILRLGVYEILYCEDIPHSVSINEAVELGKNFGGDTSPAFINGILDSVAKEQKRD
ncbi:transcription antitermination factor NusB [Proteinivorax hydrogeniformans]|uniref:Transcription antitermination protein NusB n=1 Tax=Proteinivorax hydrogeniformans TaxID=1826727 RepID=A0AAU8HQH2_9FIRM